MADLSSMKSSGCKKCLVMGANGIAILLVAVAMNGCNLSSAIAKSTSNAQHSLNLNKDLSVNNPGVVQIDDPTNFSQVVAVSDVHGMYAQTLQLLSAGRLIDSNHHWIGGHSLLMVVGDSIDEGPQSIEVLDLWAALASQAKAAGGSVVHLLGNHEAEFLADPSGDTKAEALRNELQQQNIPISDLTDPSKARGAFIHGMPLAARVGHWLFLHAGFYPNQPWSQFSSQAADLLSKSDYGNPFIIGSDSVLEAKDWWTDPSIRSDYEKRLAAMSVFGVVQGHQPKAYNIPYDIGAIDGGHLIKIDNGMAPKSGANPGHLLRFPNPSEMTRNSFPTVQAIAPDGTIKSVIPVN